MGYLLTKVFQRLCGNSCGKVGGECAGSRKHNRFVTKCTFFQHYLIEHRKCQINSELRRSRQLSDPYFFERYPAFAKVARGGIGVIAGVELREMVERKIAEVE